MLGDGDALALVHARVSPFRLKKIEEPARQRLSSTPRIVPDSNSNRRRLDVLPAASVGEKTEIASRLICMSPVTALVMSAGVSLPFDGVGSRD
jgi:hypothetical protein